MITIRFTDLENGSYRLLDIQPEQKLEITLHYGEHVADILVNGEEVEAVDLYRSSFTVGPREALEP